MGIEEKNVREVREEAAGALAVYDYFARLFLDPVEIPGSSYLVDLHDRTVLMFGGTAAEEAAAFQDLTAWVGEIEVLRNPGTSTCSAGGALEDAQRLFAADRTRLCRGTSASGPLPPYEEYYADARADRGADASSARTAASEAYRQAGVHMDEERKERDDYAGTELAFLAHLARRELASLDQEDFAAATALREMRAEFERDHLPWMRAFAQAALPHAASSFWKGALAILEIVAE